MTVNPNHVPRAPVTRARKSKWESLNQIDARFGRRSAELREAREAHEGLNSSAMNDANDAWGPPPGIIGTDGMRIPEVDVVTGATAPEGEPISAWWGVALAAVAAACALAFSIVAQ